MAQAVSEQESPAKKKSRSAKRAAAAQQRQRVTQVLPTDRITFNRQLDILRAYAIASGPSGKSVANGDVASIVKMVSSTVSMGNAFFTDIGLLTRSDGGFVPAAEVVAFNRAFEWKPETAASKLAPIVGNTWFAERLLPRVQFQSITEEESLSILGEEANAGPEYRGQLRFLLDYMQAAGLILRDGTMVEAGQVRTTERPNSAPTETDPPLAEHRETMAPKSATVSTSFMAPTEGVIQFHVSVKVDMAEFEGWQPQRISAFFAGIAQVLAAKGQIEEETSSS